MRQGKTHCKRGHPFPESFRAGKRDCLICHRNRELARNRSAGIEPRKTDSCPKGHPYPENKRPNGKGCAACHREATTKRYWDNPEKFRREASEYQKAHRPEVNARLRRWYQDNIEERRAYNRELQRERSQIRAARGNVKDPYLAVLRRDPCAYCGGEGGSLDHIVPVVDNGGHTWENLTSSCRNCNSSKKDRSLLVHLVKRGRG